MNKKSLLDELEGDEPLLLKLLTDPMQLGLILGAFLGALWVAHKAGSAPERMSISPGAFELGDRAAS